MKRNINFRVIAQPNAWDALRKLWKGAQEEGSSGLSFLIPETLNHTPIAYGQGEGEIRIGDLDFGVYQGENNTFVVVALDIRMEEDVDTAQQVVKLISSHWAELTIESFVWEIEKFVPQTVC